MVFGDGKQEQPKSAVQAFMDQIDLDNGSAAQCRKRQRIAMLVIRVNEAEKRLKILGSWGSGGMMSSLSAEEKKIVQADRVKACFGEIWSLLADETLFARVPSDSQRADLSARESMCAGMAITKFFRILHINSGLHSKAKDEFIEQCQQMQDLTDCSEDFLQTFMTILSSNAGAVSLSNAAYYEHARRRAIIKKQPVCIARSAIINFVLKGAKIYCEHVPKTTDDLKSMAKYHSHDFELYVAVTVIRFLNKTRYQARMLTIDGVARMSHDSMEASGDDLRKLLRAIGGKIGVELALIAAKRSLFWWKLRDFNCNSS